MSLARIRQICIVLMIGLATLTLTGCGDDLDGTYHDPNGTVTLVLKSGKATLTWMGETRTLDTKIDKDMITLINPKEGNFELKRNPDHTLTLNGLITLKKS